MNRSVKRKNTKRPAERPISKTPRVAPEELFFGKMLRRMRQHRQLTQAAAARLLGVSQPTVNEHETRAQAMSEATLIKYAKAYQYPSLQALLEDGLTLMRGQVASAA